MKAISSIVFSTLLLFGIAQGAQAQNAPQAPVPAPAPGTVNVITYIEVATASIPKVFGVLRQYRDASGAEQGITGIDLYHEVGRPDRFAVNEQWQNRMAYEAHKRAPAIMQLLAALKDYEIVPPDSHVFQGLSVGPAKPPINCCAMIYVVGHFEIPAARLADFNSLVKPFADMSRAEHGGMRFDILQDTTPPRNQLTIFESWTNSEDLEAHRRSDHVITFRRALEPLLTRMYDDRTYGKFD
jgi:quinol monooxygenase YgiN